MKKAKRSAQRKWTAGFIAACGLLGMGEQSASAVESYKVHWLPLWSGQNYISPVAFNNQGQVIGGYYDANYNSRSFLYEAGRYTALGTLGSSWVRATAINNRGEVVGQSALMDTADNQSTVRAFLYKDGQMTNLGTLAGAFSSSAHAINDSGEIVGSCGFVESPAPADYPWAASPNEYSRQGAFVYRNGAMEDLGFASNKASIASLINNGGEIVGRSSTQTQFPYYRGSYTENFRFKNGVISSFNFSGVYQNVVALSDTGLVTAIGQPSSDAQVMLMQQNASGEITTFPYISPSPALPNGGILTNNHDQLLFHGSVTENGLTNQGTFLMEKGQVKTLSDLLPPLWKNDSHNFVDINDNAEILGQSNFVADETKRYRPFILKPNALPAATSVEIATNEDKGVFFDLSGSDGDGDALNYKITGLPQNGRLFINFWSYSEEITGLLPHKLPAGVKSLYYRPNDNYSGTDTITFQSNDGANWDDGFDSAPATISLTVKAVNDPPVAQAQSVGTDEDTTKAITLSATDSDGDALTYEIVAQPTHGVLSGQAPNLIYTPAANYNGSDSFSFKASDGTLQSATAVVSIAIAPVNDAPLANDASVTLNEDASANISVSASDADGDALTYSIVAQPSHGVLSGQNGQYVYTPVANFHGSDSFTYQVSDGKGGQAKATVNLTIMPVNDAPTANAQNVSVGEDSSVSIALQGSDVDGDSLTYNIISQPAHGVLSGSGANRVYTPAANFNGADSFTFQVSDGKASSTAEVQISVTPVNDAPVAANTSATTKRNTSVQIALRATDVDGDALTYSIVTAPRNGTLSGSGATRTYTPKKGFTGSDSFTFKASDGTVSSDTAAVTITVTK